MFAMETTIVATGLMNKIVTILLRHQYHQNQQQNQQTAIWRYTETDIGEDPMIFTTRVLGICDAIMICLRSGSNMDVRSSFARITGEMGSVQRFTKAPYTSVTIGMIE
jgi:hypothetical protein